MKRKAVVILESKDARRAICLDVENANELLNYLERDERHKKKFRHIAELLLNGLRNSELYSKENINARSKNVTAMKFFKGQENDRIYCQEKRVRGKTYYIICSELFERKKSQKADKKVQSIINKVSNYEYEIEEH